MPDGDQPDPADDDPPDDEETREADRKWSENPETRAMMDAFAKGIVEQNRGIEEALNHALAPYREFSKTFAESLQHVIGPYREYSNKLAESLQHVVKPLHEQNRLINEAFAKALPNLRTFLRLGLPPNLRQIEEFKRVADVAEVDGIPLVHVPRGEIARDLLIAVDSKERRGIIGSRAEEILDDCQESLAAPVDDEETNRARQLALRTVEMYRAGYFEAAQSVAVSLSERLIAERVHTRHGTVAGTRYPVHPVLESRGEFCRSVDLAGHRGVGVPALGSVLVRGEVAQR